MYIITLASVENIISGLTLIYSYNLGRKYFNKDCGKYSI